MVSARKVKSKGNKIYCPNCEDLQSITWPDGRHEECKECCPHDEFDHYICIECGYEKCPGEDIDAAEYLLDPDR